MSETGGQQLETTAPKSKAMLVAEGLKDKFGDAVENISERLGETTVYVKRGKLVEICQYLRTDEKLKFNLLSDLTGFDRGLEEDLRFEVVYQLTSIPNRMQIRLKVRVSEDDAFIPTVSGVWVTANWHERETFDLFGINFEGHPDLRKILTPEDLEGHPLRKDFPLRGY